MTIRVRQEFGWRRRGDKVIRWHLQSVLAKPGLLFLCTVVAACGIRPGRFALSPTTIANPSVYPLRVGVVVDKKFVPYKIKFRYWSSTPFTWSLGGLPDAFVETLSPYFLSVEPVHNSRGISTGPHDLIAKMSVDRLHFDGANTTVGNDTVDLTMTFTLEQPNGTEVFRTTVSARASSPYQQPCAFCKPDPREAFTQAFSAAFAQLSETLTVSGVRLVQRTAGCHGVSPTSRRQQRRRALAELNRQPPRIAQHEEPGPIGSGLVVEERGACPNQGRSCRIRIDRGKRQVKPQRMHRRVIGHGIDRIAVDLDDHAAAGVGEEVNVRRGGILAHHAHSKVFHVPGGHRRRIRNIARDVFHVQHRHRFIIGCESRSFP